jgi:hypothetical protein
LVTTAVGVVEPAPLVVCCARAKVVEVVSRGVVEDVVGANRQ